MPQQRLTDRSLAPYITGDTLIHIVNTGDTSQYFGGSSYKATIDQVANYITQGFTTESYWTSGSSGTDSVVIINSSGLDATANRALAWGNQTLASGSDSTASGFETQATGSTSTAQGYQTIAGGSRAHAEGYQSRAMGNNSHAEGNASEANGNTSHAEGWVCIANGDFSHAEGWITRADGDRSHSQGYLTIASGNKSHAGGDSSIASGETSFIHSTNSLVTGARSVLLGGQNLTGTTDDTVYVPFLNINNLGVGSPVNNLGIDSNGFVVVGTTGDTDTNTFVTGGTYSAGTATFTNNNGGTFDVTGFTSTDTNFANTNLNLTGTRFHDLNGFDLTIAGGNAGIYLDEATATSQLNLGSNYIQVDNNGIILYHGLASRVSTIAGSTVINEAGGNVDLRVESDTNPNMLFVDASTNRVGIGTNTPAEELHIDNGDILVTNTNGSLRTDIQNTSGPLTLLSGGTTELTRFGVVTPTYDAVTFGIRGASEPTASAYGKQGDAFIYSSTDNNGFNIVSRPGTGTDDYVRFFVGQSAGAAGTPDLYIQGSGTTRGNVGINTDTPIEKLHVNGNTKISGSLNIGNILGNTPIGNLGFDSSGNVVTGTTGSVSDIYVTGGTFDNNTDTITFTNTSGGTFDVTGITDTFVIAGTFNDTTNTLSLLRNDGNFVNITGVTDTFTGNTSGDCITDLYVTNLYGCSPLHIDPSGLNNVYIVENGGNVGIGTTATTVTLDVAGETRLSGSGQNVLTIIGSGDTQPLFTVQGSSGELFSVTDSLVGSLFSVNDISGLPILEVFDDDTIHMGNYQAPSLNTTVLLNPGTGLSDVYSIPVSAYTGAFFDYTVLNTTGARAGNIMSIFSGSTVEFSETTTNDIGSTSDVTFTMSNDGSNATLQVSATTTGWEVKTIVRSI